jgi:hypothetical protein
MAKTQVRGNQVLDATIQKQDLDTQTPGQAVITQLLGGTGVSLVSTGVDPGTGVVTITITQVVNTGAEAKVEQTGGFYGPSRLVMLNDYSLNGAMFQTDNIDVVDFIFSPGSRVNANIRYELRPTYLQFGNSCQFEIGPADNEWFSFGNVQNTSYVKLVSTSTVSGTNIDTEGFSTNLAVCKVRTATTQSISSQTNTKLVFGTVSHGSNWVAATNRYVAPTAGLYHINASVRTTGTNRNSKLMLYKNGILVQALQDCSTTTLAMPWFSGATDIELVATDYLELWFYASGTSTIANSPDCQFCIRRVA